MRAASAEPFVVEAVAPSSPVLARVWERLQCGGAVATPFLTWEWFSAFAGYPEVSRHCTVLLVHGRNGETVGLFPVEIAPGPGRLRTVRCAGSTAALGADHLDVVAAPADRPAVARAVTRFLCRLAGWDQLDLEGLVDGGALAQALQLHLRAPGYLFRRLQTEPVAVVSLQGHQGQEVQARLRRRSARGTKWAERAGGGYSVVEDPALVGPLLETLMLMHNERFGDLSRVFSTPALRAFHVTAAQRMAKAGLARVCRLSTDESDIALEYVLLMGDRAFSYQSGFRSVGHSPGRTLMCRSMLTAAGEGRVEYDLLRGDEAYKTEYATGARRDVRIRALRPTPRAAVWLGGTALRRTVERRRRAPGDAQ